MSPKNGWRLWWSALWDLRAYFRGAEYPMGRVDALWSAARTAWRWP